MSWYYAEAGESRGPVTDAELSELVRSGAIRQETLVWREGMAEWRPYGQVQGAAPARSEAPPVVSAIACSQCGKSFSPDEVVHIGGGWVCAACKPTYLQRLKEGASVSGAQEYAGFWIRFAAKFIDSLILGAAILVPVFIIFFVVGYGAARRAHGNLASDPYDELFKAAGAGGEGVIANAMGLLFQMVFVAIHVVYSTIFLGKYGATPGKMVCKVKVVDADGNSISYGRALGRSCAEILSRMICMIGYIIAAFDEQKRALHDHICSTRVVHTR